MKIDASGYMHYLLYGLDSWERDEEVIPLYHPLGFVSCVIPHPDQAVKLRLHYWPEKDRRLKNPNWPVHTHNYRLSSLVLSGTICDKQYSAFKEGGGDSCLYAVEYSGEDSLIRDTGERCSFKLISEASRAAGQQYCVERGTFHESVVMANTSAATFVCLTQKGTEPPLVAGEPTGQAYPYERERYSRNHFWRCMKKNISDFNRVTWPD